MPLPPLASDVLPLGRWPATLRLADHHATLLSWTSIKSPWTLGLLHG